MPTEVTFNEYWKTVKAEAFPPDNNRLCVERWQAIYSILGDYISFPLGLDYGEKVPQDDEEQEEEEIVTREDEEDRPGKRPQEAVDTAIIQLMYGGEVDVVEK